jgi:raffinose/stachyose/melibiose transport system substrate-binding protein
MKNILGLTTTAAVAALALAACTGAPPASQSQGDAKEIRYLIAQPETPEQLALVKEDLKKFESTSGIKVKLDVLPNDNLQTILQTQLRSGEGPDVFDYGTGPAFSGVLAKAGLLYDLTDAYQTRGWKIYPFAKERSTFDGKAVGIPANIDEIGIFYNKEIFSKLGITEPTNLQSLKDAAAKIKAAGIVPFAVADKDGWEGGHLLSMALSSRVGTAKMDELLTGKTPWSSPDVVAALQVWDDLNKSGYLSKSPTAVAYDNANSLFFAGKAAMNPTGSWLTQGIEKNAKFEAGFIPFPSEQDKGIFSGGLGSGTFISAKTTKTDAALKFLEHLVSAERGRWQVENLHTIPAFPVDTAGVKVPPLFSQVLENTSEITKSGTNAFGYNIDVLTTDAFNKAMWDGVQGVFSGQKSPDQVAKSLESVFTTGS